MELVSADFWATVTVDKLEEYREEIRHLIEYPVGPGPTVEINHYDILSLFGDKIVNIKNMVERLHNSIMAA